MDFETMLLENMVDAQAHSLALMHDTLTGVWLLATCFSVVSSVVLAGVLKRNQVLAALSGLLFGIFSVAYYIWLVAREQGKGVQHGARV
ncbi:MAG: hypothetical protein QXT45_07965 [Candidatus Bilamarchaeaceae archaeon]